VTGRPHVRLHEGPLPPLDSTRPPWPGQPDGDVFVRRTPWRGGEPALFVHGLGGAATNWTDLMGLLADRLDGEAVDLPGFGHSPPPRSGRYGVSVHARAVVDLLDRRGRGPVHLFGNSLGGAVSTRVAAWRPDLVRTLTLVSPALPNLRPTRGSDPRLPLLLLPGLSGAANRRLAAQSPQARAQAVLALCYGDPSRVPPQRLAEAAEEVGRRNGLPHSSDAFLLSLRGLVRSYLQRGRRALWQQAAAVRAPTLLVWGDRDRLVDPALAPRALRTFPDARLLVLPGVGHVAQMEDPETVARAFLGLLDDVAARRVARPA
jgi:pimeloyl-ACP methyl ester carboxylesterase